ncbi:MAG: 5'/3'-nucleotidase SurE, partial [Pseudomonadota bacterium]
NFPDKPVDAVSEIEVTSQGARDQSNLYADKRQDVRGFPYFWIGFKRNLSNPPEGTDLRAIYEGRISVTPLHLNLTEGPTVSSLRDWLGGTRKTILTAGRVRASKGGGHG